MIVYNKDWWGFPLLLRLYGSSMTRTLPFAIMSMLGTLWLNLINGGEPPVKMSHPYPFTLYAFIVGFAVVFRTNFAITRYWEGRTQIQILSAELATVAVQLLSWDRQNRTEERAAAAALARKSEALMHANNKKAKNAMPQSGERSQEHDEIAEAKRLHTQAQADLFHIRLQQEEESWFRHSLVHLLSLTHALALQNVRADRMPQNLVRFKLRRPSDKRHAHGAVMTGTPNDDFFLAQRRGDIEDPRNSKQRLSEHERPEHVRNRVKGWWIGIIKLPCNIESVMKYNEAFPLPVISGLSNGERELLQGVRVERTYVGFTLLHNLIAERVESGGLSRAPAPVLTRCYAAMDRGSEAYMMARKLADTPFPFPHSQLITGLLVIFAVLTPFMVASFCASTVLSCVFTLAAVWAFWTLNEVARELEDPFVYDPNNLPLSKLQSEFNLRLIAISGTVSQVVSAAGSSWHELLPGGAEHSEARTRTRFGQLEEGLFYANRAHHHHGSSTGRRTPRTPATPHDGASSRTAGSDDANASARRWRERMLRSRTVALRRNQSELETQRGWDAQRWDRAIPRPGSDAPLALVDDEEEARVWGSWRLTTQHFA